MKINIQHEETGRMQEWPTEKPIPYGWQRTSEPWEDDKAQEKSALIVDLTREKNHMLVAIRAAYEQLEPSAKRPIPSLMAVRNALELLRPFI